MTLTGNVSQHVQGCDRPGGEPVNDLNLDVPPATTRREMLRQARDELYVATRHGDITDDITREHVQRAHDLIRATLREDRV